MGGPEGRGAARGGPPEFAIDAHGRWLHRGMPVRREAMVRLFAGMLRREGDDYVLVTPQQRLRVQVADAPFLVVDFEREGDTLVLITNLGERYPLDEAHPLRLRPAADGGGVRAYQDLHDGISARIARAAWYRLAELAVAEPGGSRHGVCSAGRFFPLE
jgi:hypothetical protein